MVDDDLDETVRLILMDLGSDAPLGLIFAAIRDIHGRLGLAEMAHAVNKYRDTDYGSRATHDYRTGLPLAGWRR